MLKNKKPQITIVLNHDSLALCIFKDTQHAHKPVMLVAYKTIALHNELAHGRVMQPHIITRYVKDFAAAHNLREYDLVFSNGSQLIPEKCIELSKPTPSVQEFSMQWSGGVTQSSYLFAHETPGKFIFYTCNTSYGYLFQLQLIGIALQKKITLITTHTFCLLNLYKYFKGATYRQSQLASDMTMHQMDCVRFFNQDFLFRLVSITQTLSIDVKKELKFLLPALGLFLYERKSHENHKFCS